MTKKLDEYIKRGEKNILIFHGEKGGVGKSMLALIISYLYVYEGLKIVVIDLDKSNEDVVKASGNVLAKHKFDGKLEKSWEHMEVIVRETEADIFVVNLPAQIEAFLDEHGAHWIADMQSQFNIVTVWAMGPFRDSYISLGRYLRFGTGEPVFVAKSMFQVDSDDDFEVFNEKLSGEKPLDLRGGSVFSHHAFPFRLRARIFDGVQNEAKKTERWSIERFLKENSESRSGGFLVRKVNVALDKMRAEIGLSKPEKDEGDE
ncbi:division plane positioning ATPase MipZ [Brucella pseudogrignonensis]|uniref:CobQ/CobB/MinD/ParA nucleotide binding domain-containing protein n=1 Tax=Brucella pseudogrignonensis TaxID=419475 RepID=A0ABU1MEZ6_9HYPH|nr:division plane positioning ATPase MipZ [Brucella pseudogrignonensis]MDR6434625.1 hypothetical protein [Brucella pseudogrignonensis]